MAIVDNERIPATDVPFDVVFHLEIGDVGISHTDIGQCYFIEDMYSFCMMGKITFTDTQGIMEYGPFTSNETLTITYGKEEEKEHDFVFYKVEGSKSTGGVTEPNRTEITITFIDKVFLPLTKSTYSKAWNNLTASQIIEQASQDMLGITEWTEFEATKEKFNRTIPKMTVANLVKYLLKRSSSTKNGTAGYLMFHNNKGWNLRSIEDIFSNKKIDDENYVFFHEDKNYINKIDGWNLKGVDTSAFESLAGATMEGFDNDKKRKIQKKYTYSKSIAKYTLLGKKSLFRDISVDNIKTVDTGESDENIIENMYYSDWVRNYSEQQTASFTCIGSTRRYPGQMIEIEWPSSNKDDKFNKNLQGKWVIKSITHQYSGSTNPQYNQKIVVMKNAYNNSDVKGLIPAVKTNIDTTRKLIK